MTKRPRGITLLIVYFSFLVLMSGFLVLAVERAGDLVGERYGDKFKIFGLFDWDKNLALILSGFRGMVLLGLVIIFLKPFPLGRFVIIGHEGFYSIWTVVSFFFPKSFFPEEYPSYQLYTSGWVEIGAIVISALIISYLLRPKIKGYFSSKKIEKPI